MRRIHIDIESFSSVDLTRGGVYKYAEAEDFEVLLFGVRREITACSSAVSPAIKAPMKTKRSSEKWSKRRAGRLDQIMCWLLLKGAR